MNRTYIYTLDNQELFTSNEAFSKEYYEVKHSLTKEDLNRLKRAIVSVDRNGKETIKYERYDSNYGMWY